MNAMVKPTLPSKAATDWARFFEIQSRERTGRVQREKVHEVISIAAGNRIRMGVHPDDVRSQLAGSLFGRLRLDGMISQAQYNAGCDFASVVRRYERIMGIPSANPRSASLAAMTGGDCCEEPLEEDAIQRIRRAYDDMFCAVTGYHDGRVYMKALKLCILQDQPCDLGSLRYGLNALVRLGM